MSRERGHQTESVVTRSCSPSNTTNAVTPSTKLTSALSSVVGRMDPSATVTMKSKAFSWLSARLPDSRTTRTKSAYAEPPTRTTGIRSDHESNHTMLQASYQLHCMDGLYADMCV